MRYVPHRKSRNNADFLAHHFDPTCLLQTVAVLLEEAASAPENRTMSSLHRQRHHQAVCIQCETMPVTFTNFIKYHHPHLR